MKYSTPQSIAELCFTGSLYAAVRLFATALLVVAIVLTSAGCGADSSNSPSQQSGGMVLLREGYIEPGRGTGGFLLYDIDADRIQALLPISNAIQDRSGSVRFTSSGASLHSLWAVPGTGEDELLFFSSATAQPISVPTRFGDLIVDSYSADLSDDNSRIYATASEDPWGGPVKLIEITLSTMTMRVLNESVPRGRVFVRPRNNQLVVQGQFPELNNQLSTILYSTTGSQVEDLSSLRLSIDVICDWSPDGRYLVGTRSERDFWVTTMLYEVNTGTLITGIPQSVASTGAYNWLPDSRSVILWNWQPTDINGTLTSGVFNIDADSLSPVVPNLGTKVVLAAISRDDRYYIFIDFRALDLIDDDPQEGTVSTIIYDRREQRVVKTIPDAGPVLAF